MFGETEKRPARAVTVVTEKLKIRPVKPDGVGRKRTGSFIGYKLLEGWGGGVLTTAQRASIKSPMLWPS